MVTGRGGRQRIPRPSSSRPGGPAPWADLDPDRRRFSLADVRERLAKLPPVTGPVARVADSVPSAVLVPLLERDGEARLVLTKRPETMRWHRGEIVFPGGKFDASTDRDLRDTALREAREEIGLRPEAVEIVARLDGVATVASQFTIAPYVGFLTGEPILSPNIAEVERVFDVSLSELMHHDVYREERWDILEADHAMSFYELEGETVWGATARILTDFLAHLAAGR